MQQPAVTIRAPLSLAAWVKVAAFNSWQRIIELGNGPDQNVIALSTAATTSDCDLMVDEKGTGLVHSQRCFAHAHRG